MIFHRGIRMSGGDFSECGIPSQVSRVKENFEVHHVVNDDLLRSA